MTALGSVIGYGLAAARPAAGTAGRLYFATDTSVLSRDNGSSWDTLITGFANPLTTQDDLIVAGASGVPARLAKGTDGQVLTVDPTTHHLVWATPSGGGGGSGTVTTVEEADGSPTDSAVTKIVFPNGTLSIAAHVATYDPTAVDTWHTVGSGGGEPAFANSWTSAVSPNQVQFRKDAEGRVHLRGRAVSGTIGSAAFVLPSGYRPASSAYLVFQVLLLNTTANRLDIDGSTGNVLPGSGIGGAGTYVLDGLFFWTT